MFQNSFYNEGTELNVLPRVSVGVYGPSLHLGPTSSGTLSGGIVGLWYSSMGLYLVVKIEAAGGRNRVKQWPLNGPAQLCWLPLEHWGLIQLCRAKGQGYSAGHWFNLSAGLSPYTLLIPCLPADPSPGPLGLFRPVTNMTSHDMLRPCVDVNLWLPTIYRAQNTIT